jgi:purine-binding chemotaxis protein CheW
MLEQQATAPVAVETATQELQQFLTFRLQEEMFALDILPIKEIIEYGKITAVPMAPPFVRGVINLRGGVVSVIDLPMRFGWNPSAVTKRTCIVIVEVEHDEQPMDIGIVIDAVSEVLDIPPADIEPAPSFGTKIRTDFIAGMGKVKDEFIILLNANKVLAVDELALLDRVTDIKPRGQE